MTEDTILVEKVKEPSKIKYILPLKNSEIEEQNLIEDFLMIPNAHPNQYTVAMEGRPFSMLVVMNNGLRYRATMTRLVNLDWETIPNNQRQLNIGQGNLTLHLQSFPPHPIVDLDSFSNTLLLRPLHHMAETERMDVLEVRWPPDTDILTAQHIMGTAIGTRSFVGLNTLGGFFIQYPPHMRRLFKAIQKEYEKYREFGTLGHAIYTVPDPKLPPRGTGQFLGKKDGAFAIMNIRYINPNQHIKTIVHHKTAPNISFSREKEIS